LIGIVDFTGDDFKLSEYQLFGFMLDAVKYSVTYYKQLPKPLLTFAYREA
jgi:hypothetical protein